MAKSRWDVGSKGILRVDQVRQALGDVGSWKVVLCCGREVDLGLRDLHALNGSRLFCGYVFPLQA